MSQRCSKILVSITLHLGLSTSNHASGQEPTPDLLSPFFPHGNHQTTNLSAYLHSLATLLAPLSAPSELTDAFAAFDVDDSGQVDVEDLRDALLNVPGEASLSEGEINAVFDGFTGRRAFARGMGERAGERGDVFRYREFVGAVLGGKGQAEAEPVAA